MTTDRTAQRNIDLIRGVGLFSSTRYFHDGDAAGAAARGAT
ncbi:MAG TPA: hypothetical protein VIZ91_03105 [Solirubrobacterales bacterium]